MTSLQHLRNLMKLDEPLILAGLRFRAFDVDIGQLRKIKPKCEKARQRLVNILAAIL